MSTLWRYTAIPIDTEQQAIPRSGELAGSSAAEVRAALRQVGLQVIDLRQDKRQARRSVQDATGLLNGWQNVLRESLHRSLRQRRDDMRAELYDSLGTMLRGGLTISDALQAILSGWHHGKAYRRMLRDVHRSVQEGHALSAAFHEHHDWFDSIELAMIRAGEHGGMLSDVLEQLSERQQQRGALMQRLTAALTYPAIVSMVGIGVVIFLSTRTLPNLVQILIDAEIQTPGLTRIVMGIGQWMAQWWMLIGLAVLAVMGLVLCLPTILKRSQLTIPRWMQRLRPRLLRRMAVASMVQHLADLTRSGVPMVEAMRILAPTCPGTRTSGLHAALLRAAAHVEHGEDLADAFDNDLYFDTEMRRLISIGQYSGDLDDVLLRLGQRYERHARRLIDRLASILEPLVIVVLAILIGTVVMAAILPLLRLQEVI
jgi:type IV pilus assembly protein PilC